MAETGEHGGSTALQVDAELEMKKESEREAQLNTAQVLEQQMGQLFKMRVDVNDLDPEQILVKTNKVPDTDGPITFFVHPIEGIASPLNRVMSKCKFPSYCFQYTRALPADSIESVSAIYIKVRGRANFSCFKYFFVIFFF